MKAIQLADIGEKAGLNGHPANLHIWWGRTPIASTAAIHVTPEGAFERRETGGTALDSAEEAAEFAVKYQNCEFTTNEYYSIGQVANLVNSNGTNLINVTLKDGAVWELTGTSLVASLTIEGESCVIVPEGFTLTVGDRTYSNCVLRAD